jgi:hypothetical protein
MKKLLLVLALLFVPTLANAQCNGIFAASTICGNNTGGPAPPFPVPSASAVTGINGITYPPAPYVVGDIIYANTTTSMARLADPVLGSVLCSGGVVAPPVWCAQWANVKAYGAVGDGSTDDTAAVQAAINAMQAFTGGTVYFPQSLGNYCVKGGLTVSGSTAVRLLGASSKTVVDACHTDITTITLNSSRSTIEQLGVWGKGVNNDTTTFGANHPAISVGTSCISCRLDHLWVLGGSTPLAVAAADTMVVDVDASEGYGSAIAYITAGSWWIRDKLDQGPPTALPASPFTINAWAGTTSYTLGTIVSTQGYYIQCTSAGTSGGSAPALKNYGINITDGTATWQLLGATNYAAAQIDTVAAEVQMTMVDMSGPFNYGLSITNTLAGTAPSLIKVSQSVIGGNLTATVNAHDGQGLNMSQTEIGGCATTGCADIWFNGSWVGDSIINNNIFLGGPYGVLLTVGKNYTINGNTFYGTTIDAINVVSGVPNFVIANNTFSPSSIYGTNNNAIVTISTSDYYTITGNICHNIAGTCISDGASGTHKTVAFNDGGVLAVANGGTGAATFTAHNLLIGEGTNPIAAAACANGAILIGQGSSADPQCITPGGDITITGGGTVTIAANAVSNAKFRQGAGLSLVGVAGSATANVADIVGTANQIPIVNNGGTALAFTTVSGDLTNVSGAFTIANAAVTNVKLANSSTAVAGATCTLGSTCGLAATTNSLVGAVTMTTAGVYYDGPSVAQGATGTWFASGNATVSVPLVGNLVLCRLSDGTTTIDSGALQSAASQIVTIHLSGYLASPAGNLRISCTNATTNGGTIATGNGSDQKASTISAFRIN